MATRAVGRPPRRIAEPFYHQFKTWRVKTVKKSVVKLAKILGVNPVTIWHWETGRNLPSELAMYRLNQAGFYYMEPPHDER